MLAPARLTTWANGDHRLRLIESQRNAILVLRHAERVVLYREYLSHERHLAHREALALVRLGDLKEAPLDPQ
jgi:hypothetical protein